MGLLKSGERRGWERFEVSGPRLSLLSVMYGRDTLAECCIKYQCSVPAIFSRSSGSIFWIVSTEQDQSLHMG